LKIAEIVKQDIEKAGIKVNIKVTDFNSFIDTVNSRKFDAIRFAWGEPDCVDTDPYQIWHSSQWDNKGSNHTGYSNAEVDELVTKARRELDFRKRRNMFRKVHRIIAEDQPYTFLFNLYDLYFYDLKFRNVKFYIVGENPYELSEWFIPKELQK
jgi:ABC-type transport system substrate-binding protein